MPSGAKKRKAAKKKKEKGASTTANNNPGSTATRDENLKHHESDGGEVSDQQNSEGEEEEVEKKKEVDSRIEGNKSMDDVKNDDGEVEKREAEEEGVVQIERELKQDDKEEGGSSKSSSTSDDESRAVEKDISVIDSAPIVDVIETADSFSEGPSQVTDTTPVSKFENYAEKASVLVEKVLDDSGSSVVDPLSADVGEQNKNGERKLSSLEEDGRVSEVLNDLTPGNKNDEMTNAAATSDAKESGGHESGEKLDLLYSAPRDDTVKDVEYAKDSEVPGSSERQPLVASAGRPAQRTSWKGCCGLFELFTGSNA